MKMTDLHKNVSVSVLLFLLFSLANAQADPLSERGINPEILDVMVTDMSQNMGYIQQADIRLVTESEEFHDRALIIYEPTTEYGIDLYMKFDEEKIDTMAPHKFRKMLEKRMKLQHRLKVMEFQYDPILRQQPEQQGNRRAALYFDRNGQAACTQYLRQAVCQRPPRCRCQGPGTGHPQSQLISRLPAHRAYVPQNVPQNVSRGYMLAP